MNPTCGWFLSSLLFARLGFKNVRQSQHILTALPLLIYPHGKFFIKCAYSHVINYRNLLHVHSVHYQSSRRCQLLSCIPGLMPMDSSHKQIVMTVVAKT